MVGREEMDGVDTLGLSAQYQIKKPKTFGPQGISVSTLCLLVAAANLHFETGSAAMLSHGK